MWESRLFERIWNGLICIDVWLMLDRLNLVKGNCKKMYTAKSGLLRK